MASNEDQKHEQVDSSPPILSELERDRRRTEPQDAVNPHLEKVTRKTVVCKNLLMHSCHRQLPWLVDFVDSVEDTGNDVRLLESARVSYWEICSTSFSIVVRTVAVWINVKLASDYYRQGQADYFFWMINCILLPICATTLIHANM